MKSEVFVHQFSEIEAYIFSRVPGFERREGFGSLLRVLRDSENIDSKLVANLQTLWGIRNALVSGNQSEVDEQAQILLSSVREALSL